MDYSKVIKILYDHFFNVVYHGAVYSLDVDDPRWQKMIFNFKKGLSKNYPIDSIGINFMVQYFCWQFYYWQNKKNKTRRIVLGWIIGPQALQRYRERNVGSDYYVYHVFMKEYKVDLAFIKEQFQESTISIVETEEDIKKRAPDGEARLFHCFVYTRLYDVNSFTCSVCKQAEDCQALLKEKRKL